MVFLDLARKRRSVRVFRSKKPSNDDIYYLLECARWAPSANNLQPWRFIVVNEEDSKKKVAKAAYGQTWVQQAPVLIIVCSLSNIVERQFPKTGNSLAKQSVAAAIENMHLAAVDRGLGTCWVALDVTSKLRQTLDLPDYVELHGVVAVGYAQRATKVPTKVPLEGIVYFETWDTVGADYTKHLKGEQAKPLMARKPVRSLRSKAKKIQKKLKRK